MTGFFAAGGMRAGGGGGGTPAFFGKQTATGGSMTNLPGNDGRAFMTRFACPGNGTLASVRIYSTSAAGGLVKGLVYADNAGAPGALVAVGAPVAVVENGWAVSACSGQAITTAYYWLGAIMADFTASLYADASTGNGWSQWGDSGYASPPDPWSGGGAATYDVSVFAEYLT